MATDHRVTIPTLFILGMPVFEECFDPPTFAPLGDNADTALYEWAALVHDAFPKWERHLGRMTFDHRNLYTSVFDTGTRQCPDQVYTDLYISVRLQLRGETPADVYLIEDYSGMRCMIARNGLMYQSHLQRIWKKSEVESLLNDLVQVVAYMRELSKRTAV